MNIQDLISIAQHEFESLSSNSTIRQTSSDSYTHHIHTPSYQQSTVSNPSSSGSPSSSPPPIQRITSHLISLHSNQYNTQKQFPSKKSVSHDQYQHYPHHPHYPQFKVHYDSHQQSYQPHYPQPYPFTQTHPANYSLKSMDKPKVIRTRTLLSNEVLKDLNTEFLRNKFPSSKLRDEIAVKLSLSPYIVSNWFQNKRQRFKRDMESLGYTVPRGHGLRGDLDTEWYDEQFQLSITPLKTG